MEVPAMEGLDLLSTIAEVGAALAGFATLAGILQGRLRERITAFGVVETSLIAVAFSLLPAVVGNLRISAALFVVAFGAGYGSAMVRSWKDDRESIKPNHLFAAVLTIVVFATFSSGLLVVLDVYPEHAARLYSAAVLGPLLAACLMLWLTVKTLVFSPERAPFL
jgi:hypothetical protein